MLSTILNVIKKLIPKSIFSFFQPYYHYTLALVGAILYRFPGKELTIIAVTGTKGKSTTTEIVNAIFENVGLKTALLNTMRFKILDKDKRNLFKMSMPGRFFIQKFLRDAKNAGCTHVVMEMTSEGAKQFRHKFVYPDALIFTNLAKEHIESHGSYENYVQAKLKIAKELVVSKGKFMKKCLAEQSEETPACPEGISGGRGLFEEIFLLKPVIVANIDDKEAQRFLDLNIVNKVPYSLSDAVGIKADSNGSSFQIGKMIIHSKLPGVFNVSNMLGAIALAKFMKIGDDKIKQALENIDFVRGRMEKIEEGQDFDVVVDYAHTPESLEAVYKTYNPTLKKSGSKNKLICILGNTGGGRDTWKRPEMAKIADKYCDEIILTNEDPYDEDPMKIIDEMKVAIKKKPLQIILDRSEAIYYALERALSIKETLGTEDQEVAVLITGKGTDPYIMGPKGKREPWDDARVARENLKKILNKKHLQ